MYNEPRPMREIHEIQRRLYEEEKNLSPKERIAKIHKEAEDFIREYGIKVKRAVHAG